MGRERARMRKGLARGHAPRGEGENEGPPGFRPTLI